jgi:hypothetical protein
VKKLRFKKWILVKINPLAGVRKRKENPVGWETLGKKVIFIYF